MYAVIKTGGKQYNVAVGDKLRVELLEGKNPGDQVIFNEVMLVVDQEKVLLGTPNLKGATVNATLIKMERGDKVRIFKMRRRKHYQKRMGHRQNYASLQIEAINLA